MKFIILIFILSFNALSATFTFKDGTSVNGYVFHQPYSIGNISPEGVFLIVNNKFYVHNYPIKKKKRIIDHGNGRYTVKEEIVPTPAPPVGGINPYQLPKCVPARINFIQFNYETLDKFYRYYRNKTEYHKSIVDKYPNRIDHAIAYKKNKNITWGIYRAANTRNFRLNSKKITSEWNNTVKKEYGEFPSIVTYNNY
tara:strand:+ start:1513 stop:2103 length:591 start_codon:yes stop_codon:yes gene_type:complete